nr:isopeptide-forming domain-containing fimbrial protein [Microbacterium sp. CH12i]
MTYTLTGVNTGETGLDEVVITDDLSQVLPYAKFNDDVVVKVGDHVVAAPILDGTELTWTGSLAEGATVTITYSVTVNADAAGETLANVATTSATPPGGQTITPPPSETEHSVLTPLAITGGQLAPWILVLSVLLLISGGALMLLRRRTKTA